ncbi:MAG: glycosyltransferase, partial [Candidatus Levybacteria bacterium]|nr:glycosyltransferase [Candidatus Levybacteria bacterium]
MNPHITIIYVYFNTPREILDSINSLDLAIEKIPYEVIIVDNASDKGVPKFKKRSEVKIIRNKQNFGYGKAMNQGAKVARGEYLLLMNPDTIFQKYAILELFNRIRNDSSVGVIGPQQLDKSKKVIQSYNSIPLLPDALFVFSFINKI